MSEGHNIEERRRRYPSLDEVTWSIPTPADRRQGAPLFLGGRGWFWDSRYTSAWLWEGARR